MDWNRLLAPERLRQTTRTHSEFDQRNEFESDYGRVIFSPALRRMHDKTQVFPLNKDDNTHTRLTHSLEVATLSKSLGINLCANKDFKQKINYDKHKKGDLVRIIPEILSSIALCHDIGNPPFGHFGEVIIADYFEKYFFNEKKKEKVIITEVQEGDFTKYNGNAQGFRVLTKQQILQDKFGLNLTIGTLSSFLKYPNLSTEIIADETYHRKLGVFQSEKDILSEIRRVTGTNHLRNPLAFLVEAADTICCHVMDIEDGFNRGLYKIDDIYNYIIHNGNASVAEEFEKLRISKYHDLQLFNKDRTAIVTLRIHLIQRQINFAIEKFLSNLDSIENGDYKKELLFDDETGGVAKTLDRFVETNIINQREIHSLELTGCSVIRGLLDHYIPELIDNPDSQRAKRLWSMISQSLRWLAQIETGQKELHKMDNYYKLRIIVDFISGMTDKFALSLYQKLDGIKI